MAKNINYYTVIFYYTYESKTMYNQYIVKNFPNVIVCLLCPIFKKMLFTLKLNNVLFVMY